MYRKIILQIIFLYYIANCEQLTNYNMIQKVLDQCATKKEMFNCLKIQALKIVNRALRSKRLEITDGMSLTISDRQPKNIYGLNLNESKLQELTSDELDTFLSDTSSRFLQTRQLELNIPRLMEEERGKKNKGGGNGALYWALAIKGSFLAMAYQGIAAMASLALIMGKMALLLSAILGLKKLVSGGHETTTFEIIKQPKYSEQHTHSTSYEDDHRKSYKFGDSQASKRIYRAYI